MATDLTVTRLYVSSFANGTLDDTPNEVAGIAHTPFYLMLQADADNDAGINEKHYKLILSAHSTSGAPTTFATRVLDEMAGVPANDWKPVNPGANDGYVKQSTYAVDAGDFTPNGLYEFVAVLRMKDGSASIARSNEFLIV